MEDFIPMMNPEPSTKKSNRFNKIKEFSKANKSSILLVVGSLVFGFLIGAVIFSPAITGYAVGGTVSQSYVESTFSELFPQATVSSVQDNESFYTVEVFSKTAQGLQKGEVYVTKDGKYVMVGPVIDIDALRAQMKNSTEKSVSEDIPTSDKPVVDLYVMSFCPFGNKAEDTMKPVYNLLGDKVDWEIHFIVSTAADGTIESLHGQKEVDEDMREACVLEKYGVAKWFDFATYINENCGSDGACWETAAATEGLDSSEITTCVSEQGNELMKQHEQASKDAKATGSPTMIVNGVKSNAVYNYGDSETYKKTICSAFNTAPAECEQEIASTGVSSSGGSC